MPHLQAFNFKESEVRTVIQNNEIWFVAADVCHVLEIGNTSQALTRLDEDEKNTIILNEGIGNPQKTIVNESGLYSLILGSRKPEAKQFKKWVTAEVLPAIRKHGAYMTPQTIEDMIANPDLVIGLATKLKEEQQKRMQAEKTVHILTHVNKTYTATEIAKELGFRSAAALNKDLGNKRIQYKQNGTWVLFSKYADKGYVHIKQDVLDNGRVIYHRKWTQIGREFLLKLYEEEVA